MIINIRGTHGSGKTYIVKQILERYGAEPESLNPKGRPLNHVVELLDGSKLYAVGDYTKACGGCDGIQPYSEIWPRIERLATLGHVVFEGAMVSSSYGSIGRASEIFGDDIVFAFLDTPLEVCLENIRKRREARGKLDPLNPRNTTNKYNRVLQTIPQFRTRFNRRVVILNYKQAKEQVLDLLYNDSPKRGSKNSNSSSSNSKDPKAGGKPQHATRVVSNHRSKA
jgi:hypothetical protein